jgi:uncharacterized membrane protein
MRWLSLGVLVGAGLLLLVFWGDVPDRWIIHWSAGGRPDGWATKSVAAALAPLVIGFVAWLLIEAKATLIGRANAAVAAEVRAIQAGVMRAVVALLCAGLTLALPLLRPRSPAPLLVAVLAVLGGVVGVAMVWASRRVRRLRQSGVAVPEGYGGVVYRNAGDARLWVPKLAGIGWTINFAHRRAWLVMALLVGLPLALVVLVAFVAR